MNTKLVNSLFFDKYARDFNGFCGNEKEIFNNEFYYAVKLFIGNYQEDNRILNILNSIYEKCGAEFESNRWISCLGDVYFDKISNGYWNIQENNSHINNFNKESVVEDINNYINNVVNDPINHWRIPKERELKNLYSLTNAPFSLRNARPSYTCYYVCTNEAQNIIFTYDLDNGCWGRVEKNGIPIPFVSSYLSNDAFSSKSLLIELIERGFIPSELENNPSYELLLEIKNGYMLYDSEVSLSEKSNLFIKEIIGDELVKALSFEDNIRADLLPLNKKIFHDTELGHWSLWQDKLETDKNDEVTFSTPLVARDPKSSINDGIVAIDFGTKSTVVVNQRDNVNIHPMRIGTGDLSKEISAHHYENPTIMEFIDLDSFINAYLAKENKPYTHWKDLTISHTAQNSMQGSESSKFNTFLNEIKQWAGDKNRKLKIVCQQGKVIDLPPFLELSEDDFNPIEIYAYYLGLYINNINNGIYLDYILSFPVTYEMAVRDKIIASFEKGLKKSLPAELGKEFINRLTVTKGASEPAAYALTALEEYEFEPEGDERIFYGVFDFGGGTTDFDFGIFSEPTERKDRRFDYVIEHFGAGGDKFLGGENLLELLAFEIFKKNRKTLLEKRIQFEKHPEQDVFAGSEQLLSNSQEARMNTRQLCIALRPFWEEHQDFSFDASGELSVTLTDLDGVQHSAFALDIDEQELNKILSDRIEKGVENFFDALRLAFSNSRLVLDDINRVNIFLAGNSSKSSFVESLFNKHISIQYEEMGVSESETRFELFPPLGVDNDGIDRPTCKTGVAFGLIKAREGGSIKVIDHDIDGDDVCFKYYLGESRKNKFKPIIEREIAFNQWQVFTDAYYQKFEIFFTEQPSSSTGQVSITDNSIKKKTITINVTDDEAMVYLRVVSPSAIEYVVANENDIDKSIYLCDIERLEF